MLAGSQLVVAALKNTEKGRLKYDCGGVGDVNERNTKGVQIVSKATHRYITQRQANRRADLNKNASNNNADLNRNASNNNDVQLHDGALALNSESDSFIGLKTWYQDKDELGGGDAAISPRHLFVEKQLSDVRENANARVMVKVLQKKSEFDDHDKKLLLCAKKTHDDVSAQLTRQQDSSLHSIHLIELELSEIATQRQKILQDLHHRHAKEQTERLENFEREVRMKENERLKILEERRRQLVASISSSKDDVETCRARLQELVSSCRHPKYLPDSGIELMNTIREKMTVMMNQAERGTVSIDDARLCAELTSEARKLLNSVAVHVDEANRRGDEEVAAANAASASAAAEKQKADERASSAAKAVSTANAAPAFTPMRAPVNADSPLLFSSSTSIVERFEYLRKLLEQTAAEFEPFLKDAKCSKDRFDLQKAVNTPINAISAVSGSHLRDKLYRLRQILDGQSVELGGRSVCARKHRVGVLFCKDLLAKKIVKQGEEQVSSNFESAFPLASVAVGIWCEHPDVGELILANFYQKCPYLAPFYIPRDDKESREHYYRNLGYIVQDGDIEQQDKFLRRMSGFVHLYAAIIVSSPPPEGRQQRAHPHGIEHAWILLSHLLNTEPRPDITATVIHDLLSVAGFLLNQTYGRQYVKLVRTIASEYLPRIAAATPEGASGPVTRLDGLLKDAVAGRLTPPKGLLSRQFWNG